MGNDSPGVVLVQQKAQISEVIESILVMWLASDAGEHRKRIIWLPL